MTGALYPGTFDPITNGHHDLVRRAVDIFGRVLVAIAANPGKAPLFTVDERVELAREVLRDIPNVEVTGYTGLTVDFARQHGLKVVVRGLRAVSDFEFEFQLATMSRHLSNQVDYVFLTPADRTVATLPAQWAVQRTKSAGQVGYHLLRASDPAKEVSP